MTVTVVGIAADSLGHSLSHGYELDQRGVAHHHIDAGAVPASAYRVAGSEVAVEWRHRRRIGEVTYLERSDRLTVVAELDVARLDGIDLFAEPVFWSPECWETRSRHGVDAELLAVGLTPTPGSVGLLPVRVLAGDVEAAARRTNDSHLAGILTRAARARSRRHYGDPLRIHDIDTAPAPVATRSVQLHAAHDEYPRPGTPIEWSSHRGRIISVR